MVNILLGATGSVASIKIPALVAEMKRVIAFSSWFTKGKGKALTMTTRFRTSKSKWFLPRQLISFSKTNRLMPKSTQTKKSGM